MSTVVHDVGFRPITDPAVINFMEGHPGPWTWHTITDPVVIDMLEGTAGNSWVQFITNKHVRFISASLVPRNIIALARAGKLGDVYNWFVEQNVFVDAPSEGALYEHLPRGVAWVVDLREATKSPRKSSVLKSYDVVFEADVDKRKVRATIYATCTTYTRWRDGNERVDRALLHALANDNWQLWCQPSRDVDDLHYMPNNITMLQCSQMIGTFKVIQRHGTNGTDHKQCDGVGCNVCDPALPHLEPGGTDHPQCNGVGCNDCEPALPHLEPGGTDHAQCNGVGCMDCESGASYVDLEEVD